MPPKVPKASAKAPTKAATKATSKRAATPAAKPAPKAAAAKAPARSAPKNTKAQTLQPPAPTQGPIKRKAAVASEAANKKLATEQLKLKQASDAKTAMRSSTDLRNKQDAEHAEVSLTLQLCSTSLSLLILSLLPSFSRL